MPLADSNKKFDQAQLDSLVQEFHRRHDALYGYSMPDSGVELINLRVTASGMTDKPGQEKQAIGTVDASHALLGERKVYFRAEFEQVPVFEGLKLHPGNTIQGPAIVVQPTTTIVVPTGYD